MSSVKLVQKAIDLKMVFAKHASIFVLNAMRKSVLLALKGIEKMVANVNNAVKIFLTVNHVLKKMFARSVKMESLT
jgi:hypothetical protein